MYFTSYHNVMSKGIVFLLLVLLGYSSHGQNITTLAGNGIAGYNDDEGVATAVALWAPAGIAMHGGNIYIADAMNNRVRKLSPSGYLTTIAGQDDPGYRGDGRPATDAQLNNPAGLAVDIWGNIYIADKNNNRVRKINQQGIISAFAGTGEAGYTGNGGLAVRAELNAPVGLVTDSAGDVFIADAGNNCIRKVNAQGMISTIAGTGVAGFRQKDSVAVNARLNTPTGLAIDSAGNIYVADSWNYRIRKVTTDGRILTLAGTGAAGYGGDGGMDTLALLNLPTSVAVDRAGNLYFSDQGNNVIRSILPNGKVNTIAGTGVDGFSGDGGPATAAQMNAPTGIVLDQEGRNLYVAEQQNNRVRRINLPPAPVKIINNQNKANNGLNTSNAPKTSPLNSNWSMPASTGQRPVQTGTYNRRKNS